MDVGNPSNFERLKEVFQGSWEGMASRIEGRSVTDARTLETMRAAFTRPMACWWTRTRPWDTPRRWTTWPSRTGARRGTARTGDRPFDRAPGQVFRHRERGDGRRPGDARAAGPVPQAPEAGAANGHDVQGAFRVPAGFVRLKARAPQRRIRGDASAAHSRPLPAPLLHQERIAPVLLPRLVDPARLVVPLLVGVRGSRVGPVELEQERETAGRRRWDPCGTAAGSSAPGGIMW